MLQVVVPPYPSRVAAHGHGASTNRTNRSVTVSPAAYHSPDDVTAGMAELVARLPSTATIPGRLVALRRCVLAHERELVVVAPAPVPPVP